MDQVPLGVEKARKGLRGGQASILAHEGHYRRPILRRAARLREEFASQALSYSRLGGDATKIRAHSPGKPSARIQQMDPMSNVMT